MAGQPCRTRLVAALLARPRAARARGLGQTESSLARTAVRAAAPEAARTRATPEAREDAAGLALAAAAAGVAVSLERTTLAALAALVALAT